MPCIEGHHARHGRFLGLNKRIWSMRWDDFELQSGLSRYQRQKKTPLFKGCHTDAEAKRLAECGSPPSIRSPSTATGDLRRRHLTSGGTDLMKATLILILVTTSFLLLLVRHLFLEAMHLFLVAIFLFFHLPLSLSPSPSLQSRLGRLQRSQKRPANRLLFTVH